ncbi:MULTISPECIES: ADP-ribosylglycohydrolase family protein [Clostridium]|uniref:ADP-ribosylglycohydrolase family protein n=1 Tax=Clostridium sporogenes TaxID=1509 RepID=A0AAE6IB87_CLOSG|nr:MULTISPECIES: ADP-ribosylglycohydrolase family protein [Clostridium]APQ78789.1 ADP-ribosylglycohydrolase family protein [Clostridium botulinum]MBN3355855.1 ADP-ribosylglycohydrolase family protein [Clostridium botulinum]QDY34524.1 ADP-ribosylglycohydrolase family protein [Clostridium sporogenes]
MLDFYFQNLLYGKLKLSKKHYKVLSGLFGLCVGDALGVPVEFISRKELKNKPINDMLGYRVHYQPPGTWSDDSSMSFCLAESLCNGIDTADIGNNFCKWLDEGYWTPYGRVFDIGNTTLNAITKIKNGIEAEKAGDIAVYNNGNGSLMRILPLVYYLENYEENRFDMVHKVSGITHGHIYSKIACSIYVEFALNLLKGNDPIKSYINMQKTILEYYTSKGLQKDLDIFHRILNNDISLLSINEINSSGYVIHTLEAALWSFLNSRNYKDAVLAAINLGNDTDTTGAVTGGIAGIYYGYNNIPQKWINTIARKNDILNLSLKLSKSIYE